MDGADTVKYVLKNNIEGGGLLNAGWKVLTLNIYG